MYNNIGAKIKALAMGTCFVEAIGSIIAGIILAVEVAPWCIVFAFVGPILAWYISLILYAFGQLVEDNELLRKHFVKEEQRLSNAQKAPTNTNSKKSHKKTDKPIDSKNSNSQEFSFDENDFIDIQCPNCGEQLSFFKEETNAICPNCEFKINI